MSVYQYWIISEMDKEIINYQTQTIPRHDYLFRGAVKKNPSIFKDIIQIKIDPPPTHPIFDKFIFDKMFIMLTSLPPLEFLTKILTF